VPRYRAVVTDLDNTLYPWVDFIVPALEAMVASLVTTTGLPRIRIVQALKAVYTKYESNEYPFAIQESGLFEPYQADFDSFDALVVRPAREAFRAARLKYLHPYPGVAQTLDALRKARLEVIGLTDAPRNAAELRLKHLKLDGHFDALYTMPAFPLPENVDPEIKRKEEAGHYRSRTPVVELPHDAEKPSPAGLARILADHRLAAREVLYVGDNVKKDMPVAEKNGVTGVWAEYGTYVSAEYRERLAIISAKSVTRRHVADETTTRWPKTISSFVQVLELALAGPSPARRTPKVRRARRRPSR
jgi:phosphoglycolate phosphatase